ncbi:MAG: quinol:cytochrome C oxidoreductase [Chitinophagales bacterium]|nr:quinol:cytochrome C oxidoreductase [Bacteroidota bacterium]MCB9044361.1 quinol:cytochrome C oxidoreductase [Chitinophagales bacterium]
MIKPFPEYYKLSPSVKTFSFVTIGVGLVFFIIGVLLNLHYPARIWSVLFSTNLYFTLIGLAAIFWVTSQTIGYNGWFILLKRIPEAMGSFVKWGALLMIVILALGSHSIYHWMHEGITNPASPDYDALIAGKKPFLNQGFFWIATIVYLGLWVGLIYLVRKNSLESDKAWDLANYRRSKVISMFFLVVFAVSTSTAIWHWLMSVDPHWLSTLYGWYCFISMFVGSLSTIALITIYLKENGHLKLVNDSHIHDLGKWVFAFSVAWTYLWFSQFMLIWYGNIPEETLYYRNRFESYQILYWLTFFINFVLPLLVLMTAGNKRNPNVLRFVAILLVFGHWLDYYLMVTPGAVGNAGYYDANGQAITNFGIGFMELGLPTAYLGFFVYVVFTALSKSSLVPINHPFVKESITHQT